MKSRGGSPSRVSADATGGKRELPLPRAIGSWLGIADAMAGKSSTAGPAVVASGEAEIVVQPVSEILPVPGVELVGTIPPEVDT